MSKTATAASGWREARRQSARDAIVDAAWELVRQDGLAGLSIRDLAKRAGITTPTIYAYFDSKHAIYDAMFGRAATEFADRMAEPFDDADPAACLSPASSASSSSARRSRALPAALPAHDPRLEPSAESLARPCGRWSCPPAPGC